VPSWAFRYSFILGASTILGTLIHRNKLVKFHSLCVQEILLIFLVGVIWLSKVIGYNIPVSETNAIKVTKFFIMLLIASRLIVDNKSWNGLIWVMIITGLYMGWEAFNAPPSAFFRGRLDSGVGGSDFNSSNLLGAHFALVLPFIGIKFLQGDWKVKGVTLIAGAFVFNGIVLCRSRGVFLALAVGGMTALLLAKKEIRKKILVIIIIGFIGGITLIDPGTWIRVRQISVHEQSMDASAAGRLKIWRAAVDMFLDNPLGVGEGNFKALVGKYNPAVTGKDTHNTFLKCMAELGIQGVIVLGVLILNAFKLLRDLEKKVVNLNLEKLKERISYHIFAVNEAIIITLVAGCFSTRLYMEEFYWFLMMPLFLKRVVETEIEKTQGHTRRHRAHRDSKDLQSGE